MTPSALGPRPMSASITLRDENPMMVRSAATTVALLPNSTVTAFDFGLSASSVAMTVALAIGSTLVFGLIPALKLIRIESSPALQSQGVRSTGGRSAARSPA